MNRGSVVPDQPQHLECAGRIGLFPLTRLATLLRLIPRRAGHSRGLEVRRLKACGYKT
jgi:hypothetical protein